MYLVTFLLYISSLFIYFFKVRKIFLIVIYRSIFLFIYIICCYIFIPYIYLFMYLLQFLSYILFLFIYFLNCGNLKTCDCNSLMYFSFLYITCCYIFIPHIYLLIYLWIYLHFYPKSCFHFFFFWSAETFWRALVVFFSTEFYKKIKNK